MILEGAIPRRPSIAKQAAGFVRGALTSRQLSTEARDHLLDFPSQLERAASNAAAQTQGSSQVGRPAAVTPVTDLGAGF